MSVLVKSSRGLRAPITRALATLTRSSEESSLEFMAKVKEIHPVDTPVRVIQTGPDSYDYAPVEGLTDFDLIKLQELNEESAFFAEEEEHVSIFEAAGLGPWYRKAQLGFMFGVTAVSKEMYIMNEETFVAGCLGGFGLLLYLHGREPFLHWYEGEKATMLKAQNDAEDQHIAACQNFLNGQGGAESLQEDMEGIVADKEELVDLEATSSAIAEQRSVKAEFERRLNAIVQKKSEEQEIAYRTLVSDAKSFVAQEVQSAGFQKKALAFAITAISDPQKAGVNPTAKLFESFLAKKK